MARPRKQQVDYVKVKAVALAIVDWAGIARTGYAMARWFEQLNDIEPGTLDEKMWSSFLNGQQPQYSTLDQLLLICPQAHEIYHHPLWMLLRENCNSLTRIKVLNIYGFNSGPRGHYAIKALQKHTTFDRLTVMVAGLTLLHNGACNMYQDTLDSVAQLVIERKWYVLQEEFCNLLFGAIESSGALFFETASYEVRHVIKFWQVVYAGYAVPHDRDSEVVWFTWRCVIREMYWRDRLDLAKYLNVRERGWEAEVANGKKQLKRIQRKVYRCCPRVFII